MRWLFLIGGFIIVAWAFQDSSIAVSIGGGIVYVIFLAMKKDPRVATARRLTRTAPATANPVELPLGKDQGETTSQENSFPPQSGL